MTSTQELNNTDMEHANRRPNCTEVDGVCPYFEMAQSLGRHVHDTLMTFIATAETSSRLTLQKSQSGFTLQVTGAVQRSDGEPVDADYLTRLRHELASRVPQNQ